MLEAKTYRQYAADCVRIAEKMDAKDKKVLLEIAQAWDMRAEEAERREIKPDGKTDGKADGKADGHDVPTGNRGT
jgi:hypothetical protein